MALFYQNSSKDARVWTLGFRAGGFGLCVVGWRVRVLAAGPTPVRTSTLMPCPCEALYRGLNNH